MNKLFYGDNLEVLRDRSAFPDGLVDLIYLDPPFNSNAGYNVLYKDQSGRGAVEEECPVGHVMPLASRHARANKSLNDVERCG